MTPLTETEELASPLTKAAPKGQVIGSRGWYNPQWNYQHDPETCQALDLIFSDYFSSHGPGMFEPLRERLLTQGDHYMHPADLNSYLAADAQMGALCQRAADAFRRP